MAEANRKLSATDDEMEAMEVDIDNSNASANDANPSGVDQEPYSVNDIDLEVTNDINNDVPDKIKNEDQTNKTDAEALENRQSKQHVSDVKSDLGSEIQYSTFDGTSPANSNEHDDVNSTVSSGNDDVPKPTPTGSDVTGAVGGSGMTHLAPQQSVYHVKWVKFKGDQIAIITQNENGPCPLLAIMNCLLLQAKVKLPVMMEIITSGQLMEYLGDCIFENAPKNLAEETRLNYEQNMSDAMAVFDRLQTGLDVNVRFTGVHEFEYTRECIVFDLLNLPLYHGWLADPQNRAEIGAVGQCSYNQLVEKIIEQKSSSEASKVTEALVAEDFLNRSCHQLTYHGLSELSGAMKEGELSVFFRNNHFSTLLRHKNELFTLVTDQGYLTEPNVVWETLSNVEGDGHYVDSEFRTYRKPEAPVSAPVTSATNVGSDQQIDQDFLVALSLQDAIGPGAQPMDSTPAPTANPIPTPLSDQELARKLQEEEDHQMSVMLQQREQQAQQRASQPPSQRASQPPSQPASHAASHQEADRATSSHERESREKNKKSSDCAIL